MAGCVKQKLDSPTLCSTAEQQIATLIRHALGEYERHGMIRFVRHTTYPITAITGVTLLHSIVQQKVDAHHGN